MIFIDNKYTKCYNSILSAARAREIQPTYTEKHHVIPKALGGEDSDENLVKLTAREHFLCHWLLTKMIADPLLLRKMQFALNSFRRSSSNQCRYILSSRQYEMVRKQVSAARSQSQLGNKFALGFEQSAETIAKRNAKIIGMKKKPWTDEQKRNLSKVMLGKTKSSETRARMSLARKGVPTGRKGIPSGRKMSDETKAKISASQKARNNLSAG